MVSKVSPFVSVIILNYFGERVIKETIESVLNSAYSSKRYEIIIVDNNSRDKSVEIIKELSHQYSNIKLIENTENLGFARGNNIGIKSSRGEYVILLNNDCIVDKNWISNLVTYAEADKNIFAVTSKLLLYPKYINVLFKYKTETIIRDCKLSKSHLLKLFRLNNIPLSYYEEEGGIIRVEVPFDPTSDREIVLTLKGEELEGFRILNMEGHDYKRNFNKRNKSCDWIIKVSNRKILKESFDKIQSAGTVVFQDGYGRDIGAIIRYQTQSYENDYGQYNQTHEVYAGNGAALLFNKAILDKIGLLDESFFMYYEDVEICERARLFGYDIQYAPDAIVRHMHSLSSKEWSSFFVYQVEKGRLLHIYFAFPFRQFLNQYAMFGIKLFLKLVFSLKKPGSMRNLGSQIKVFLYFPLNIPILMFKKRVRYKGINKSHINANFKQITQGYWYR